MKSNIPNRARPFLKWAGGKSQLINNIAKSLPLDLRSKTFTYIEPFAGSGAVFFWMMSNFPQIEKAVINDINADLIGCYNSIKNDVENLIDILAKFQFEYHKVFDNLDLSKDYYYTKRELFNSRTSRSTVQSALFIFLNKTCFNGLYRVNRMNLFNVPIGRSKSLPNICDKVNLIAASEVLQNTLIMNGDYSETIKHADGNTLFYFDPPYKPLNETSSFNSYAMEVFNDPEQIRLKEFCKTLNDKGYQWILSNSDLKNVNPENNFFDELYSEFKIQRIDARRSINSKSSNRGLITELLITNHNI
ncbi:MAG: DNA adenine methylase [Bacteroidia bacterium]